MEYKLLRSNYLELDAQVNQYLSEGWELYGHTYCNDSTHFQPMVKGMAQLEVTELKSDAATPAINIYLPEGFEFQKQVKKAEKPNG